MDLRTERITPTLSHVVLENSKAGDKLPLYMLSDIHIDNIHCNRQYLKAHLEECKKENGLIFIFGDLFCLMQGNYDPRKMKSDIRPEHNVANYIDAVINEAVEFFAPYKDNLAFVSYGNHETSILKRLETDVIGRFIVDMQRMGSPVQKGSYCGFIKVGFNTPNKKKDKRVFRCYKTMFYHHGKWGGIISKGAQGVPRFAAIAPQADYILTGHTHDQWAIPQPRFKILANGEMVVDKQWHLKLGTYKEEFEKGAGWAVQQITMPKALGGIKVELNFRAGHGSYSIFGGVNMLPDCSVYFKKE